MIIEIISRSISTKVWDWARIKLATPGSAVRLASAAGQVTDCATWPGKKILCTGNTLNDFFLINTYWGSKGCKDIFSVVLDRVLRVKDSTL